MQRPDKSKVSDGAGSRGGCPDERFASEYPSVTEFLTLDKYDDGTARKRSSISLFVEQGVVKLALYDKDGERSLFTSAESLPGALSNLEAALNSKAPPWVGWRKGGRK
jgi:hypothetical protein